MSDGGARIRVYSWPSVVVRLRRSESFPFRVCQKWLRRLIPLALITDLFVIHARLNRFRLLTLLAVLLLLLPGCETAGYYGQAIRGEAKILAHRRAIDKVLADPHTPPSLQEKLRLVLKLREFAAHDLKLPANGHYLRYVELHRRYVVWNVEAAPEFSLKSKSWWYPIVGRQTYRGYFSEAAAQRYAASLARQDLDVSVEGIEAYSTLGWFKDPVLSSFIDHDETELAEIIFHELAHQRLFLSGDTDFNEAFATAVAEEGVRRWLRSRGGGAAVERYEASLRRHRQFLKLIAETRRELESLYGAGKSVVELRQRKADIFEALRARLPQHKGERNELPGYDGWFAQPLNNARLNTVATYYDLVPAFQRQLAANGGDLEDFFREIKALAKLPKAERHRRLE